MPYKKILIVLIIGFVTNLSVYSLTVSYPDYVNEQYDAACNIGSMGIAPVTGGMPFSGSTDREFIQNCGLIENSATFNLILDSMKTWQYYANWFVWSIPFTLIMYVRERNHANSRD